MRLDGAPVRGSARRPKLAELLSERTQPLPQRDSVASRPSQPLPLPPNLEPRPVRLGSRLRVSQVSTELPSGLTELELCPLPTWAALPA